MDKTQELELRIKKLEEDFNLLRNNATIPKDVGEAFKARVGSLVDISSKSPSSESQAVDESGASVYNVAKLPDGFFYTAEGKFVPYYD